MAQSDDSTRLQHDVDEIKDIDKDKDLRTPEDEDDEFLEGGDKDTDLNELNAEAFGDEDDSKNIADRINEDEVAIAKDLDEEEQNSDTEE